MQPTPQQSHDPAVLKQHFVHHLNRMYYGKTYLQKHLSELIEVASFNKLKFAIKELLEDVNKQVSRFETIYQLIDTTPGNESSVPIIAVFKDAFEPTNGLLDALLNDVDIILYLQLLEHINITSYRMLKILAASLAYNEVGQLLLESFDESTDNDKLFVLIANEYIQK